MAWLLALIAVLAIGGMLTLARSQPNSQRQQEQNQSEPPDANQQSKPETHEDREQKSKHGAKEQEEQNVWERFVGFVEARDKFVTALSTVVIAAFTLALFVATGLLWYAGEKHSQRQLRPYVFFENITSGEIVEGHPLLIQYTIKNFGQTPAYDFVNYLSVARDVFPPPKPFPHKLDKSRFDFLSKSIIGPGAPMSLTALTTSIAADKMSEFRAGRFALYVYGEAIYRDAFGRTHHLHYRGFQGGPGYVPGRFTLAEEGNYESEDK